MKQTAVPSTKGNSVARKMICNDTSMAEQNSSNCYEMVTRLETTTMELMTEEKRRHLTELMQHVGGADNYSDLMACVASYTESEMRLLTSQI